ncbi:putative type IV restriction endonuclease [Thermoplasmatales archaeon]|nr:putative type IV restriction endonuclease [Thermoplasmatales archaeon]
MYSKEMISRYVDRGAKINTSSERNFREIVVGNLLEAMGWDMGNENEVATYFNIQVGTQTSQADYLISNERSKFILEVKQPNHEIEENITDYGQTHSYARLTGAPFGVLYNGRKMIIFRDSSKQPVYIWKSSPDTKDLLVFECLAKENFPDMLEEFLASQEKLVKLKTYIDENSEMFTKEMVKIINTNTGLNPEFVDSHISVLVDFNIEGEGPQSSDIPNSDDLVLIRSFRYYGPGTGLDFARIHRAWGFIRVRTVPKYLALYDIDNKEISKLYAVRGVEELSSHNIPEFEDYQNRRELENLSNEGYKIVRLGEEISIRPIPKGHKQTFRGGKFTTLDKVRNARTMDDL